MTATTNRSTQHTNTFQRREIDRLTTQLDWTEPHLPTGWAHVPIPKTRADAEHLIGRLKRAIDARADIITPPTFKQLAFINQLAGHDDYAPETFDEADAIIKALLAPSPAQLYTLDELAAEMEIPVDQRPRPVTGRGAARLIRSLIEERAEKLGYKPATPSQLDLLVKLADEQDRSEPYAIPRTYDQANAKIRKILATMRAREAQAKEPVAA